MAPKKNGYEREALTRALPERETELSLSSDIILGGAEDGTKRISKRRSGANGSQMRKLREWCHVVPARSHFYECTPSLERPWLRGSTGKRPLFILARPLHSRPTFSTGGGQEWSTFTFIRRMRSVCQSFEHPWSGTDGLDDIELATSLIILVRIAGDYEAARADLRLGR